MNRDFETRFQLGAGMAVRLQMRCLNGDVSGVAMGVRLQMHYLNRAGLGAGMRVRPRIYCLNRADLGSGLRARIYTHVYVRMRLQMNRARGCLLKPR